MLSIVVPTLNEATTLPLLLEDLAVLGVAREVIVADGGSADETVAIAIEKGALVVSSVAGRGRQLRAGAAAARGAVYLFVHADARLTREACAAVDAIARQCPPKAAFALTLRIAGEGWRYRLVEWGTARRSRIARLPYGDQGLLLSRDTYEHAGGFDDLAVMEDVAIVRALARFATVHTLPESITVSARRWERDGVLRRTLKNWLLIGSYFAGASAKRLASYYRPSPASVADAR